MPEQQGPTKPSELTDFSNIECINNSNCDSGNCKDGRCKAKSSLNEPCASDATCDSSSEPLVCDTWSNRCKPAGYRPLKRLKCYADSDCNSKHQYCFLPKQKCLPKILLGKWCQSSTSCADGLSCHDSVCKPKCIVGSAKFGCSDVSDCKRDSKFYGVCESRQAPPRPRPNPVRGNYGAKKGNAGLIVGIVLVVVGIISLVFFIKRRNRTIRKTVVHGPSGLPLSEPLPDMSSSVLPDTPFNMSPSMPPNMPSDMPPAYSPWNCSSFPAAYEAPSDPSTSDAKQPKQ